MGTHEDTELIVQAEAPRDCPMYFFEDRVVLAEDVSRDK